MEKQVRFGTCSWNYNSWVPLVYPEKRSRAAEYLSLYARKYDTAEIDSWFYRIPSREEVMEYRDAVPKAFRFTCKVPMRITLTHHRKKNRDGTLNRNEECLSVPLFEEFIRVTEPILEMTDAVMFEFEYLNKQKMGGVEDFIDAFERFCSGIPKGFPYAVETRNGNYLGKPYYEFIRRNGLIHVFSEKIYMPHVYDVYTEMIPYITESGRSVLRLMGGDRKKIEAKADKRWDTVIDPKDDLDRIAEMIKRLSTSVPVTVNVNNHYEGSAPRTIERIRNLMDASPEQDVPF
jgi:uncharacterized protein YecE (DUF72 family)